MTTRAGDERPDCLPHPPELGDDPLDTDVMTTALFERLQTLMASLKTLEALAQASLERLRDGDDMSLN
ncbi:MAG: hypothetical protein KKE02_24115 [Alphaproteobacteria bacterium]|nr:hypothetical protein [Alphaproteobacteria bacterium]MBU1516542.1 hypothetical protein [Alphaproteobacteria bacterium]MBU2094299.1 hypothetical protein [Alphaproteobacteria bacterium]MBU2154124.1 hypothetical protein [Alphaproteobacteria bacterium]MBU2307469.1 hypothetical protein [Alphaproteobacteria bacterium]